MSLLKILGIDKYTSRLKTWVNSQIDKKHADFVGAAPEQLDTLNELAAALANDPNFAATITAELAKKANKTDIPTIPTPDWNQNNATAKDYIKNRPFYSFINIPFAELNAEESDPNRIEAIIGIEDEFCIRTPYWVIGPFNDMDEESYEGLYTPYGNIISVFRDDTSFYFNTDLADTTPIIEWLNENAYVGYNTNGEDLVKHIPDIYISNNIARKSDIVTPDWNAQEGEDGYIENKLCHINFGSYPRTNFSDYDSVEVSEDDGSREFRYNNKYGSILFPVTNYDNGELSYIAMEATTKFKDIPMVNPTFYSSSECSFADDGDGNLIVREGFAGAADNLSYFIALNGEDGSAIYPLPNWSIPDTVIKTTPQTLADTDKNQALSNLGIDPVVWKYMCNPITIREGGEAPNDIIEIFTALSRNCFNLIYTNRFSDIGEFEMCIPDMQENDGWVFTSTQGNGSFVVNIENNKFVFNEY